jgi:hypothetical protein
VGITEVGPEKVNVVKGATVWCSLNYMPMSADRDFGLFIDTQRFTFLN